ncbi:MAG: preprotein translocase subunit SecA [Clostridia bacterium]|nr:preprotein translocase subunit SecA [Clostridia bacterium]
MMGLFSSLFKSENERQLVKLRKIADKVVALEEEFSIKTNAQLKQMTQILKDRLAGGETLDDILPEAFATVREASWRVLNMKHFYVQILGGIVLHQGRIAEMRTGEGKTLVATLPAYLNALTGKGMHVVTVNEYLAQRDAEWMGKVYRFLGLTVGVNLTGMSPDEKRRVYACDIVYGTNNEFGFDYLRDNMAVRKVDKVQRGLEFAVVDEVDSILIDEARTPLIISGKGTKSSEMYISVNKFVKTLKRTDYEVDEKDKAVRLLEDGIEKAERYFGIRDLSDIENTDLNNHITLALRAHFLMKRENDYIVKDGEVIIVDEFTGRLMIGRRYSEGLHQAIEAKENVRVQSENQTLATITFQNYFRMYHKLSGMTGTAKTEETEFEGIYALDVIVLPTNLPIQRVDMDDQLYTTSAGKIRAIVKDVVERHAKGQPILIGTVTVEKSEQLSVELKRRGIRHNVLNAKNHEQEAEIIAQAGKKGSVTIATNMAGRGTDIMLGGNAEYLARNRMIREGYTPEQIETAMSYVAPKDLEEKTLQETYAGFYNYYKQDVDVEKAEVLALGGLHIIGTERHESRRIDNQLRGRAGRQGDPGTSVFYISMEDDLARIFGGDRLKSMAEAFHFDPDEPIANKLITRSIESAQKNVEGNNYSARRSVIAYDDVMNKQREIIYAERNKILEGIDVRDQILDMLDSLVTDIITTQCDYNVNVTEWDYDAINRALEERVFKPDTNLITLSVASHTSEDKLLAMVIDEARKLYAEKVAECTEAGIKFDDVERFLLLKTIDRLWIDHIDAMDQLRKGIRLRAYGQRDPVMEYKSEGLDMFEKMTERIKHETARILMKVIIKPVEEKNGADNKGYRPVKGVKREKQPEVSRNAPCPCGSGLKYKHCCGKE